jgi:uncharacterized membrane protein YsdA (DUF1294 family)
LIGGFLDQLGVHFWLFAWLTLSSAYAFVLFGSDKIKARRGKRRISERHLLAVSILGGWLGGLAGMLVFRHKTAKGLFLVKFCGALLVWLGLLFACGLSLLR